LKSGDLRGGASLAEVAAELGVCRERVRQIETQALAKLRRALERQGLTFADLTGGNGPDGWPQHVEPVDLGTLPVMATGVTSRKRRR
jgi:hypothetical protein